MLREPAAEFLGVMILIIFGNGVDCQVVLSSNAAVASSPKGDYLSLNFGWAIGTALGVWVSAGISGGHINPAASHLGVCHLAWLSVEKGARQAKGYIAAQLMGGLVGAALVYANYFHAIDIYEGGRGIRSLKTASLFSTYAVNESPVLTFEFGAQFTDQGNHPPPDGLLPLFLFILVLGIGAALGMETGYALNPARDLGPRLFTSMVGYGKAVYTFRNQYWLWCPILAPVFGAQVGAMFYEAFLYNGSEGKFNQP
ncbi:hypothetical protein H0H93_001619, partial [Arthromyces matolae]